MNAGVDLFTLEVIRHAFSAIAEEMSLVVMRSARSPLLREAGDLSSAITDAHGEPQGDAFRLGPISVAGESP